MPYESSLPDAVRAALHERFTGDLDQMVKRRLIRVGVTYNRTNYFVENGVQRGITYEHLKNFEDWLNTGLKTGNLRVHVVFLPMSRERMLKALVDGEIDPAEGQLTITRASGARRFWSAVSTQREGNRRHASQLDAASERGGAVGPHGLRPEIE